MSCYDEVKDVVYASLANQDTITDELIVEKVHAFSSIYGNKFTESEKEKLIRYMQEQFDISMDLGATVCEPFTPWLDAAKTEIDPYYWSRYKKLLQQKGFGLKVIPMFDRVTDKILGLLENPAKQGEWFRKGLVVGHVQSGKTANYTGLICKAADAGYRFIIVIAGTTNNLRSQTQARIDEGFVGRDSSTLLPTEQRGERIVGVGKFGIVSHKKPITLTTTLADFRKSTAEVLGIGLQAFKMPVVIVVKKNSSTLGNLIEWLKGHSVTQHSKIEDCPMLMIDDEADLASINTHKDPDEATKINKLLRELLFLFHKRCYVGYTATPFANIFIDPDNVQEMIGENLFPRDFIVSLDSPSNYVGPEKIFGSAGTLDIVIDVDDFMDVLPPKHDKYLEINVLPESLYEAVLVFILIGTIRILRGQKHQHNSMLVNVSFRIVVQAQIRNHIHDYLESVKQQIRFNYKLSREKALLNSLMADLYRVWQKEYSGLEFAWDQIQGSLKDAVMPMKVIEINYRSADFLNYSDFKESGLNVIAVGGFSLSRGLTLEGLSVSYFLRNSIMYDTLMQMGRWFGYRPGYEDLCRLYMTPEASSWYSHISNVIEELRDEFIEMDQDGRTPEDFGLKVRSHPDSLIVTARNKMRTGEKIYRQITLSKRLIETNKIYRDPKRIEHNLQVVKKLLNDLEDSGNQWKEGCSGNYLWVNVTCGLVTDFLRIFENHPASLPTQTGPVIKYIQNRSSDELKNWDVVLVSLKSASEEMKQNFPGGLRVGLQKRKAGFNMYKNIDCIEIGSRRRVATMGLEKEGLSSDEIKIAESNFNKKRKSAKQSMSDSYYRAVRTRPLLMLHILNLYEEKEGEERTIVKGAAGYGISFPKSNREEETVEYVVNPRYWQEHFAMDAAGDEYE